MSFERRRWYGNADLMSQIEELLSKSKTEPTPPTTPAPAADTVTKAEHDSLMKKAMEDFAKREKEMASQMESLKNQFNGTTEEKAKLEAMLKEIETRNMSAEERAKAEIEKERKANQKALEEAVNRASSWEKRFISRERDQKIVSSATLAEAFNPQQIVDLLSNKAKIEPDKDDKGVETGSYSVKIPVQTEDGVVDMPIDQAINHMKESGEHRNLFKSKEKAGFGFREPSAKETNLAKTPIEDLAAELRKVKR